MEKKEPDSDWKEKIIRYLRLALHDYLTVYLSGNHVDLAEFTPSYRIDTHRIPVWSCWWQGFQNAPEIIRVCRESQRHYFSEELFEFHEISLENVSDYFTFPQWVLDRFHAGTLAYAHFADILRMGLLYYYGGVWIDATYYVAHPISPDSPLFTEPFFTLHTNGKFWEGDPADGQWVTNLFKLPAGHLLSKFVLNAFYYYLLENESPVHYYMIDFLIRIAYREYPEIRAMIDGCPVSPTGTGLQPLLNTPYDPTAFEQLKSDTTFFKLTYKEELMKETSSGQKTFWGVLSA